MSFNNYWALWGSTYFHPFKPAGFYASQRFRRAHFFMYLFIHGSRFKPRNGENLSFYQKVCINRNFRDSFFFCIRVLNSIARHHTKFQGKVRIRRKIVINKILNNRFYSLLAQYFQIALQSTATKFKFNFKFSENRFERVRASIQFSLEINPGSLVSRVITTLLEINVIKSTGIW